MNRIVNDNSPRPGATIYQKLVGRKYTVYSTFNGYDHSFSYDVPIGQFGDGVLKKLQVQMRNQLRKNKIDPDCCIWSTLQIYSQ